MSSIQEKADMLFESAREHAYNALLRPLFAYATPTPQEEYECEMGAYEIARAAYDLYLEMEEI